MHAALLPTLLLISTYSVATCYEGTQAQNAPERQSRTAITQQLAVHAQLLNAVVLNATVGETLKLEVNRHIEYIIQYEPDEQRETDVPLRVKVITSDATLKHPINVVVRQQKAVLSWQLPIFVADSNNGTKFLTIARTLCYDPWINATDSFSLRRLMWEDPPIVSISTSSLVNVSAEVIVEPEDDFKVEPNKEYSITVTPSEPKYFYYDFPDNVTNESDNTETVVLVVTSPDNVCMTVSIQNASCPVFDLNLDVKFEGLWETMNRKGGITISKSKFPFGFFVVFVPQGDDVECEGDELVDALNRTKSVSYVIKPSISYVDYVNAIMATCACILLFYVVFGVSFFVCSTKAYIPRTMEYMGDASLYTPTTPVAEVERPCLDLDNVSCETDYDTIAETILDKAEILAKDEVFLSDLARKDFRILKKKSYSYLWHILTVALFYGLPVAQLVITYQKVLNDTGNLDLCYYNFLCAHPLGFLSDFNHLFSNVGYVAFGLLFLWIVHRRERWHKDNDFDAHYGIPQHYGMFYAIGVALTMEGVLSGSYHVCPNHTNFQFDSSFMYVIAVLGMVKIYQTRHPDINATAYSTFGVLAVAIFLGMWGILASSYYFWVGFTGLHVFVGLYLTAQIYYFGCWRVGIRNYCRDWAWTTLRPKYTSSFALLAIGNACNWALAVYGLLYHQKDFAMHLLAIFMINTIMYFIFYVVMKIIHKERVNALATCFLVIALTCACTAMYCFLNKSISWALTPAGSRQFNQECRLMRFYDYHDVWHFLSAVGMFFMFMVILLLDDDLSHVHRTKIRVF